MDYSIRSLSYKYVSYDSLGNILKRFSFRRCVYYVFLRSRRLQCAYKSSDTSPLTDSWEMYIRCIRLIKFLVERFSSFPSVCKHNNIIYKNIILLARRLSARWRNRKCVAACRRRIVMTFSCAFAGRIQHICTLCKRISEMKSYFEKCNSQLTTLRISSNALPYW